MINKPKHEHSDRDGIFTLEEIEEIKKAERERIINKIQSMRLEFCIGMTEMIKNNEKDIEEIELQEYTNKLINKFCINLIKVIEKDES